ncbi:MAG: hypothetical protein AAFV53_06300 [Myxococcota bacterium]
MRGEEIYAKGWLSMLYLGIGLTLFVLSGATVMVSLPIAVTVITGGLGLGAVVLGVLQRTRPMYTIFRDEIEARTTPLSRVRRIIYNEVTRLEEPGNDMVIVYMRKGAGEVSVKLPMGLVEEEQAERMIKTLRDESFL